MISVMDSFVLLLPILEIDNDQWETDLLNLQNAIMSSDSPREKVEAYFSFAEALFNPKYFNLEFVRKR